MHLGPSVGPLIPREFDGVPGPGWPAGSGAAYNGERGPDNDRFLLSCTHYSLGLYAALIEVGRLDEHALDHYDRDGSTVEQIGAEHSPGIEVTTGSLAQALSIGLGIALARQERGDRGRVWVYMSDGSFKRARPGRPSLLLHTMVWTTSACISTRTVASAMDPFTPCTRSSRSPSACVPSVGRSTKSTATIRTHWSRPRWNRPTESRFS